MVKKCNHKYKYYTLSRDILNRKNCFEIQKCEKCGSIKSVSVSKEMFEKLVEEKRRAIFENRPK